MEIAIVGGGCSALLLLLNLLPQLKNTSHNILLFSDEPAFGRGVAYSTNNDAHLLNGPAGNMSAYQDDPEHFLAYCRSRDDSLNSSSFVPRRFYGEYLSACWQQLQQNYASQLRRIFARVHALEQTEQGYLVRCSDGSEYRADYAVLALGHFSKAGSGQREVSNNVGDAGGVPRKIGNSWSAQDIRDCDGARDVLLIGSGHTAVDVVLSLQQLNKPPRIHMLSRRGLLSNAHRVKAPEHKVNLGAEHLLHIAPTAKNYLHQLRQLIARYQQQGGDWRDVIGGLRAQTPELWQRLPRTEKQRFMRHVWSYWDVHRHRLAPAVAGQLAELFNTERLSLCAGRIDAIYSQSESFEVRYRPRGETTLTALTVDRIIDCTGPNYNVAQIADPLVQQLHRLGVLRQDVLQMGFCVARDYRVHASDEAWRKLFYLGPMLRGRYLESVGVPELRQHAASLSQLLTAELRAAQSESVAASARYKSVQSA